MPISSNAIRGRQLAYAGLAALILMLVALDCNAAELERETIAAFNHYVSVAEQQLRSTLRPDGPFLWIDSRPKSSRNHYYQELRSGQFVIRRLQTYDDGKSIEIPDGMVHHWIGIAFVPGATLKSVEGVLEDYQDYSRIYAPQVRRSKILSRNEDGFKLYMQLYRGSPREVAYNADFDVQRVSLGPTRIASSSVSSRIVQLQHPSQPDSPGVQPGQDSGYLWRLNNYWRYEQKDGGVYMQVESISLSRDVPGLLSWFVRPIIYHIARETIASLLDASRHAVESPDKHVPNGDGRLADSAAPSSH